MDLVPQYLIFKISYTTFSVKVSKVECGTHKNDHFEGYFIKIKVIFKVFYRTVNIPWISQ